jgi:hypothetical protein
MNEIPLMVHALATQILIPVILRPGLLGFVQLPPDPVPADFGNDRPEPVIKHPRLQFKTDPEPHRPVIHAGQQGQCVVSSKEASLEKIKFPFGSEDGIVKLHRAGQELIVGNYNVGLGHGRKPPKGERQSIVAEKAGEERHSSIDRQAGSFTVLSGKGHKTMKPRHWCIAFIVSLIFLLSKPVAAADSPASDDPHAPHTPTLIFYLSGKLNQNDLNVVRYYVTDLKTADLVEMNTSRGFARVRFDSHVVSYHQIAQAIADAGEHLHKHYDPYLIFIVPDYAKSGNAAKVDAIFAGKRLNQRVHVTPLDKTKGIFQIHFLPLESDQAATGPQGFNGGHLHHPLSDPPPNGLGLPSSYAADDEPTYRPPPETQPAAN